jgi:dTDP-4-amino-4,6-dideoxygalactose transaminase
VNSCSQAIVFAQQAMNIDGKVLIPTQSFVATLNSVIMAGNTPVFCDVDDRALMDVSTLDYGLSGSGIEAVMYVNLFGNIVDYERLRMVCEFFNPDGNVKIIEDAAQSFGAYYNGIPSGKLGDVSVLSFDPTKNLPNYGSGGMILTDDENIASVCYNLRDNGKISSHTYANSKMSEVDCAHMLIKLKYFDEWQRRRTEIAEFYNEHLIPYVDPILPNEGVDHAWHKYVIRIHSRDVLQGYLASRGIETKIHYDTPLHEHALAFDYHNYGVDLFRNAVAHSKEALSLPIYPEMTDKEVEAVATAIVEYYAGD